MNKTTISIFAAAACGLATATAGTPSLGKAPAKGPVPDLKVPGVCDCFNAGSSSVSVYASGLLPNGNGELDDAFGGGLAYDYFFTPNVGFMVDAVNAVVDIGAEFIAPPPQFGAGVRTDFLRGIGKVDDEFVLVLNVERLLDFDIPTDLEEAAVAAMA